LDCLLYNLMTNKFPYLGTIQVQLIKKSIQENLNQLEINIQMLTIKQVKELLLIKILKWSDSEVQRSSSFYSNISL
jgi:hypothetical protein